LRIANEDIFFLKRQFSWGGNLLKSNGGE